MSSHLVATQQVPDDMPEHVVAVPDLESKRISRVLVDADLAGSMSEARRLVSQGAVRVNDDRVDGDTVINLKNGDVIRVGRRRFVRIVADQD